MRRIHLSITALAAVLASPPAMADQPPLPAGWPANVKALITRSEAANDRCRGGSGDNPETFKACDRRAVYERQLDRLGWCKGREGEAGFEKWWHRCGRNSIRS